MAYDLLSVQPFYTSNSSSDTQF